jgi:hypothetical protein
MKVTLHNDRHFLTPSNNEVESTCPDSDNIYDTSDQSFLWQIQHFNLRQSYLGNTHFKNEGCSANGPFSIADARGLLFSSSQRMAYPWAFTLAGIFMQWVGCQSVVLNYWR